MIYRDSLSRLLDCDIFHRGMIGRSFFGYDYYSGWYWLIGLGILVLGVAIFFIVRAAGSKKRANNQALEMLKLKFAKGEITEEEYIARKSVLLEK